MFRYLALLVGMNLCMTANAQSWPNKPVRLIIPYAAGGPTDVMARKLGVRLSTELGQPVVIENKPGAGGVIGVDAVVKANADGYTLGLIAPGPVAGMPALTKVPYSNADIDYITLVSRSTSVIATSSQSPFENLNALINAAKKAPGTLNYGSAGNGTSPHIGGEMLKQEAGIDVRTYSVQRQRPHCTGSLERGNTLHLDRSGWSHSPCKRRQAENPGDCKRKESGSNPKHTDNR